MENKRKSHIRVTHAEPQQPGDETALRKVARAVIAIAARQIGEGAPPATPRPPSPKGDK